MRSIVIILFALISLPVFSQLSRKQTIVLDDGSRIMGTIVSDSSGTVSVKITNPQVINVDKSKISSIEAYVDPNQMLSKSKGYYIQFSSSLLAGKNDWGNAYSMSFQLSNGYQFPWGLSVGLGSGIEHFNVPLIPLYADISYHPWNGRVSPFLYVRSGYSFALTDQETNYLEYDYMSNYGDPEGGLLLNGGVGLSLFTWNKAAVTLGLGYRFQKVTVDRYNYWWGSNYSTEIISYFNRFEMKLGFLFR